MMLGLWLRLFLRFTLLFLLVLPLLSLRSMRLEVSAAAVGAGGFLANTGRSMRGDLCGVVAVRTARTGLIAASGSEEEVAVFTAELAVGATTPAVAVAAVF